MAPDDRRWRSSLKRNLLRIQHPAGPARWGEGMCGRYNLTTPVEALRRLFGFVELPNLAPRYNIAPMQEVPIVRSGDDGVHHCALLRWGLIPFWAKDRSIGNRLIIARAETVATTSAFRAAFEGRRCLVLADGFYEWSGEGKKRQPWRFTAVDGSPFAFAGVWERWVDRTDRTAVESFAIVTTTPNAVVKPIHDRMPVILNSRDHAQWLTSLDPEACHALLRPCADDFLRAYRVGAIVNNARNDVPECIAEQSGDSEPMPSPI